MLTDRRMAPVFHEVSGCMHASCSQLLVKHQVSVMAVLELVKHNMGQSMNLIFKAVHSSTLSASDACFKQHFCMHMAGRGHNPRQSYMPLVQLRFYTGLTWASACLQSVTPTWQCFAAALKHMSMTRQQPCASQGAAALWPACSILMALTVC